MSGSSSIMLSSDYFVIITETPRISFVNTEDEREYHQSWKESETPKMEKALKSLKEFFSNEQNRKDIVLFDKSIIKNYENYGYFRSDSYYKTGAENFKIVNLYIDGSGSNWFKDMFTVILCFKEEPNKELLQNLKENIKIQFTRDSLLITE